MISKKAFIVSICLVSTICFCVGILSSILLINDYSVQHPTPVEETESTHPIDIERSSMITKAASNYELCTINTEYTQMWNEVIQEYCQKISTIVNEDFSYTLGTEQKEWEMYVKIRLEMETLYWEQVYQGGSVVPVVLSNIEYNLYRARALDLISIYTKLLKVCT